MRLVEASNLSALTLQTEHVSFKHDPTPIYAVWLQSLLLPRVVLFTVVLFSFLAVLSAAFEPVKRDQHFVLFFSEKSQIVTL